MSNRAVITTDPSLRDKGVQLEWNGDRSSVEGFLAYCKLKGYPSPETSNVGWALFMRVLENFFDGHKEYVYMGTCPYLNCDNGENGVYVIKDWLISERKYFTPVEDEEYGDIEWGEESLEELVCGVESVMLARDRLTEEEWDKFEEVKAAIEAVRR